MSITFKGSPVTLAGSELKVGDKMPDFVVMKNDMTPMHLSDTKGVRVFLSVPSLDTPVCDLEVRTFNQEVASLGDVSVYVASMDLPFAQTRWCGANGIDNVISVSDFKDRSFGKATGTYVNELGLLARAVFVVDSNNEITYVEYVPEIGEQPSFESVYMAARTAK
ncbi:thiol peroxidase [Lachnospiraceae bacterium PF1-21]|uniref:Thiol peroxidase n=1 Tax=Ohessyouella blattaphilus TaxID=2949333 RepID=A0ABT1EEC1_9FIRM|nr:thiol peroxidase [Ohessyouella blattaphilus]MCP1108844.1 thiol peroxidase [Ohessyouella blattaphilus]MCR8562238.1 thiol peroxidase [Ohessyouella blattaphilus]MDL2249105.1 thiol peroxidase [Lachnospiraceae bacterium OttesenSCG-928-J05]